MYQVFEGLAEDKRQKILDVCIEEFGNNGYEKASTNAIVKKAGISKGILFHYFKNKKNLFLYVHDYVMDLFTKQFYSRETQPSADIFERLMDRGMRKLWLYHEYPEMARFIMQVYIDIPEEVKEDLQKRYAKMYADQMAITWKDIDTSKFRKGVELQKAIELVMYFIEGISNQYMELLRSRKIGLDAAEMEKLMERSREYLEILKYGIYER